MSRRHADRLGSSTAAERHSVLHAGCGSQVAMVSPRALISKVCFPSLSTFETPPPQTLLTQDGHKHTDTGPPLPEIYLQNTCNCAAQSALLCSSIAKRLRSPPKPYSSTAGGYGRKATWLPLPKMSTVSAARMHVVSADRCPTLPPLRHRGVAAVSVSKPAVAWYQPSFKHVWPPIL